MTNIHEFSNHKSHEQNQQVMPISSLKCSSLKERIIHNTIHTAKNTNNEFYVVQYPQLLLRSLKIYHSEPSMQRNEEICTCRCRGVNNETLSNTSHFIFGKSRFLFAKHMGIWKAHRKNVWYAANDSRIRIIPFPSSIQWNFWTVAKQFLLSFSFHRAWNRLAIAFLQRSLPKSRLFISQTRLLNKLTASKKCRKDSSPTAVQKHWLFIAKQNKALCAYKNSPFLLVLKDAKAFFAISFWTVCPKEFEEHHEETYLVLLAQPCCFHTFMSCATHHITNLFIFWNLSRW